jgi:hypothetical protein
VDAWQDSLGADAQDAACVTAATTPEVTPLATMVGMDVVAADQAV